MPQKGYKTITVKETVYQYFWKQWQKEKADLEIKGIRSFSAYISYKLNELLEQEKKHIQ